MHNAGYDVPPVIVKSNCVIEGSKETVATNIQDNVENISISTYLGTYYQMLTKRLPVVETINSYSEAIATNFQQLHCKKSVGTHYLGTSSLPTR